MLTFIQFELN